MRRPRGSSLLALAFLLVSSLFAGEHAGMDPETALAKLMKGNGRAAAGKPAHPNQSTARRMSLATEQHPFAVILSCSDSRVPPELVFDQGLGDLFVFRSAGAVVDFSALGSIEYAVEHLDARLVVVLGHERCGAVKAALDAAEAPPYIASLIAAIRPAVDEVAQMKGDRLDLAVRANVRRVVEQIRAAQPVIGSAVEKGRVKVVGMYYDLDTGKVESLP